MWWKTDLHIHSCLSPCGSLKMSPETIAQRAGKQGVQLIGLTDHNSALNCTALEEVIKKTELSAVYGIEACTREEVHALCLLETADKAVELGKEIYRMIPARGISKYRDDQVIVNASEQILGYLDKFLIAGADISYEELFRMTKDYGGLFIPAHINRLSYSVFSQLGFLPNLPYDAVEVIGDPEEIAAAKYTVIKSSDAHVPEQIGNSYFLFEGKNPSFRDLKEALEKGRVELPE